MSQIQTVKLAKLTLSDINVRKAGDDLLEQFAADISARGILQNLIVTPVRKPRGSFAVIAGSRRFRALMLLAERGDVAVADYDVPVLVLTADDATLSETSLAENFQRLAMTPADECRAFQHFLGENGDIDAVAKRFGLTRRFIEGRLRLASLAEPIFDALASGKITLDLAKAYASTASHERQLMVWNSYGNSSYHSADTIRRVIANEAMKSNDPIARLVGADAYAVAGGVVDRDLFSDSGDRWTNPEIAQTLAAALMEAEAKRVGDELGLAWIRPIATNSTWEAARSLFRVNLPTQPMTDEEATRLDEIETRIGVLQDEMENEDLDEDAFKLLDAEHDTLHEELEALQRRPKILPAELAPRIGTFLVLTQNGEMELDDSYYSETPLTVSMIEPDERGDSEGDDATIEGGDEAGDRPEGLGITFRIEEGSTTGSTGKPAVDPDAAAPGGKALSQVLLDQLAVQRRDVLGAAMIANPGLALDYMLFAMADGRSGASSGSGTTISASSPQDPVLSNNVPASRARDYLAEVHDGLDATWQESGDKVARFEAFRILDDEVKAAWLAWVVATSLQAKEVYGSHRQNPLQNRLASILEVDVASWWRPTSENFFDRVSKGALLSLLDEVGGPALSGRHASSKKTEISASCQKLFAGEAMVEVEVRQAALAWVPTAMRFNDTGSDADDDGDGDVEGAENSEADDGEIGDDLAVLIGGPDDGEAEDGVDAGEIATDEPSGLGHENDDNVNDELVAAE
ncbi:ParB/RepB/Spo0J family partition protein [Sphingomonas solaris]|uniref:ParB/RepB/Spo0J family partition protein n=1 Tax=Alterirhizorhabdus solaris TaxID=2529389 RepID=A0A558RC86_9SPHN|nr:ParB/RepB/Spo0J family partition protein [Sphingomonas solaris]TVV76963.1 ParB/RepB/Spo0J family partition protein [Sphingomonas solaris]